MENDNVLVTSIISLGYWILAAVLWKFLSGSVPALTLFTSLYAKRRLEGVRDMFAVDKQLYILLRLSVESITPVASIIVSIIWALSLSYISGSLTLWWFGFVMTVGLSIYAYRLLRVVFAILAAEQLQKSQELLGVSRFQEIFQQLNKLLP